MLVWGGFDCMFLVFFVRKDAMRIDDPIVLCHASFFFLHLFVARLRKLFL